MSTTQPNLFSPLAAPTVPAADHDGDTYVPALDKSRLNAQTQRVYDAMKSGAWLTLAEIAAVTGDPEASVSARIRDLRKPKFGGMTVDTRRRGGASRGLWEYRLEKQACP